jgi:hypothetical protein
VHFTNESDLQRLIELLKKSEWSCCFV